MRKIMVGVVACAMVATTAAAAVALETPNDLEERIERLVGEVGADTPWRDLVRSEIEPDPTCDDSTPLRLWMASELADVSPATLDVLRAYFVFDWSFFWSIGGDHDDGDEFFGIDGEYTRELLRRHRESIRFWPVPIDDVALQAAHSEVIAEDSKMTQVVGFVFQVDSATAQAIVDLVQATIAADPGIDFDHPVFTFNALAFDGEVPGLGTFSPKTIMGDGILEGFEAIGLGDIGSDFIHAHEMAHHVQFELGVLPNQLPSPEATRRTELMADGFAAYNVAHVRGLTFQTKRLTDAVATGFNVGDCQFDDLNHHGTPEQRVAAVEWGVDVAQSLRPRAEILGAEDLVEMFDVSLIDVLGG
jgi:hypothetical protein